MANPLVSIVVLNWNGDGYLQECLSSVCKTEYAGIEIIVVDNGSTDDSLAWLRRQEKIALIENSRNEGFARGNNTGFAHARGRYVVALNNDMVVEPSWLNEPVRRLEEDAGVGIVACRQMNYRDRETVDVLYHIIAKDLSFFPCGRGKRYASMPGAKNAGYVLSASGGSAVYRKKMLDEIGGYDERFFAYCEDADLSMRAFLAGWKCLFVPGAVAYHRGSASFARVPEKVSFYGQRNRYLLMYKYFPFSLILARLPWIVNSERRTMQHICLGQGSPGSYFSILRGIVSDYKKFKSERKENIELLKQKRGEFKRLLEKSIIYT
jgi:hypothetical protein